MPVTTRYLLLFTAASCLLHCASPPGEKESNPVVITISSGTRAVRYRLDEFLFFVKQNYPEVTEPMDGGMSSRVFDCFKRDITLASISQAYGIRITSDQVEDFVKEHLIKLNFSGADAQHQRLWRAEVRRRMTIRELLQRKILKYESVHEEDVAAFYEQNSEQFKKEALYRLRFLQTDKLERAEAFRTKLKKENGTFKDVAAEFALNDGYELAVPMFESEVAEPFRDVVADMIPGRFSKVVRVNQGDIEHFYVLYLESVIAAVQISYEDAYHYIVEELKRRQCRAALDKLLDDFHQSARFSLEVHVENLPFNYVEEAQEKEVRS